MMGAEFQQLEGGSSVLYGACDGIWVMILFAAPSKADMLLAGSALAAMKREHPRGFPTLTWVLPEAGYRMDADARQAAADVTKEYDAVIRAQATLIDGSGFQAAAVRAIVAGLEAMSRSSGARKVFAELPATVAWCAAWRPEGTSTATVPDVVQALGATRAALVPRRG